MNFTLRDETGLVLGYCTDETPYLVDGMTFEIINSGDATAVWYGETLYQRLMDAVSPVRVTVGMALRVTHSLILDDV